MGFKPQNGYLKMVYKIGFIQFIIHYPSIFLGGKQPV